MRLRIQRELVACVEPKFFLRENCREARSNLPVLLLAWIPKDGAQGPGVDMARTICCLHGQLARLWG